MDLQQENKELKEDVKSARSVYEGLLEEVEKLNDKIKYLKGKIENKDRWCQLIADIGYDYDGFREVDNLMGLIDELVKYALYSRDDHDCLAWEKESEEND